MQLLSIITVIALSSVGARAMPLDYGITLQNAVHESLSKHAKPAVERVSRRDEWEEDIWMR